MISGLEFPRGSLHPAFGSDGAGLSPPSVVPAGSRPEAAGAFNPSWNSPAASGHNFSRRLSLIRFHRKKKDLAGSARSLGFAWWPLPELNWGHEDFQSSALPSELKGHLTER